MKQTTNRMPSGTYVKVAQKVFSHYGGSIHVDEIIRYAQELKLKHCTQLKPSSMSGSLKRHPGIFKRTAKGMYKLIGGENVPIRKSITTTNSDGLDNGIDKTNVVEQKETKIKGTMTMIEVHPNNVQKIMDLAFENGIATRVIEK